MAMENRFDHIPVISQLIEKYPGCEINLRRLSTKISERNFSGACNELREEILNEIWFNPPGVLKYFTGNGNLMTAIWYHIGDGVDAMEYLFKFADGISIGEEEQEYLLTAASVRNKPLVFNWLLRKFNWEPYEIFLTGKKFIADGEVPTPRCDWHKRASDYGHFNDLYDFIIQKDEKFVELFSKDHERLPSNMGDALRKLAKVVGNSNIIALSKNF